MVPPIEGNDDVAVLLTRSTLCCWSCYVGETFSAIPCYSRIMTHIIHVNISYTQFLDKMITLLLLEF